jgi:hypothetical protein
MSPTNRITAILKVETDIITGRPAIPIGCAVQLRQDLQNWEHF